MTAYQSLIPTIMSWSLSKVVKKKDGERRDREQPRLRQNSVQLSQVKGKLLLQEEFRGADDATLSELADRLITKEEVEVDFSHLLYTADHTVASTDSEACLGRPSASLFPVKLLLSSPEGPRRQPGRHVASLMLAVHGPLHAALLIGDLKIKWNPSSLVSVETVDLPSDETPVPAFQAELPAREQEREAGVAGSVSRHTQIDLTVKSSASKATLIDRVVEMIVTYNKAYCYHVFTRNCQTFVVDTLIALGIDIPTQLQGRLREYYNDLRKNRSLRVRRDFTTHVELDEFIRGNLESLNHKHDMEYLHCLYFQFHLESGLTCLSGGCKMAVLVERLEATPGVLVVERFLPY